jgi:mRNA interferase MazF
MKRWEFSVPRINGRVPDAGDILWIDYGAPVGHEQGGRRPNLVLTPASYNQRSSVLLACPLTRMTRDWPFQIAIDPVGSISGYVLVDQMKVIDPLARYCRFAGVVTSRSLKAVRTALAELLEIANS